MHAAPRRQSRPSVRTTARRHPGRTPACRRADVNWESRLIAAHHLLTRSPGLDPDDPDRVSDAWVSAHDNFHATLLDGCANRRLKSMAAAMRSAAGLYRRGPAPPGGD